MDLERTFMPWEKRNTDSLITARRVRREKQIWFGWRGTLERCQLRNNIRIDYLLWQADQVNEIDAGMIQPSKGPWSSPIVLVQKKDGSHRFCVDYRQWHISLMSNWWPPRSTGKCQIFLHTWLSWKILNSQ